MVQISQTRALRIFVILLMVGPLLFTVPSAQACHRPRVIIDGDPDAIPLIVLVNTFTRGLTEVTIIGNTWDITVINLDERATVRVELPVPAGVNPALLQIVQYDRFCDFNDDGKVNGQDIKLIANANKNQNYVWGYDLNQDGEVTEEDIHIANSFKKQPEQWLPLETFVGGDGSYVYAFVWHFSIFGIR